MTGTHAGQIMQNDHARQIMQGKSCKTNHARQIMQDKSCRTNYDSRTCSRTLIHHEQGDHSKILRQILFIYFFLRISRIAVCIECQYLDNINIRHRLINVLGFIISRSSYRWTTINFNGETDVSFSCCITHAD